MNQASSLSKSRYYTLDHEWIEFRGTIAYIGIAAFKLTGLKTIQGIKFNEFLSPLKRQQVLGTIISDEYKIQFHMPVDGKFIEYNESILTYPNRLIDKTYHDMWILKVAPNAPYSRDGLLLPEQYHQKTRKTF